MNQAPEMSPTLDDALRALDGFPGRPADIGLANRFLEQLDNVRDVPAVVLSRTQAECMEGAYLAGVRCADESGHVLVVSLPAFLELMGQRAPAPSRDGLLGRFAVWLGRQAAPVRPCTHDCRQGRACTCSYQNKRI